MIKSNEFIPEVFLKLTSHTYPYGSEDIIADEMLRLGLFPDGMCKDVHGNYFYKIGESRTIFASHLDTVSPKHTPVNHVFDGDIIRTDGTTTLGADDKAGVSILVWMMKHNIPGLYYFFIGEEVGCIGSSAAAKYGDEFEGNYDRIISFDRRDTGSIITHQSWSRCCSEEFATSLCYELNKSGLSYKNDDGGVYTDSAEFVNIVPECTNVSVGYYKEHSTNEHQDIKHLIALADSCLIVDWENLPTKRDRTIDEPKYSSYKSIGTSYASTYGRYVEEDWYGDSDSGFGTATKPAISKSWSRTGKVSNSRDYGYYDNWYEENEDGKYEAPTETEDDFDFFLVQDKPKHGKKSSKKPRTYFDNGELNEIDSQVSNEKHYNWIMNKFSSNKLNEKELEIVKVQYLDMTNDYDKFFYECLVEEMLD